MRMAEILVEVKLADERGEVVERALGHPQPPHVLSQSRQLDDVAAWDGAQHPFWPYHPMRHAKL